MMRAVRRHRYNPDRGNANHWLDFMRACLRTGATPAECAKDADESLAEYRKRFPEPPPDPDDDDLAALDSALSDPDSTSKP